MKPTAEHRRRKFARAYFAHNNGARAAKEAGFKGEPATLAVRGSELLNDALVKEELAKLHAAAAAVTVMERNEALKILARIARFDFGMILDAERQGISIKGADEAGALSIIEKLDIGLEGEIKVGVPSRIAALERIAAMEGWDAAEKIDHRRLPFSDEELQAEIDREMGKKRGKKS